MMPINTTPILEILFALFLMVMPEGTTTFTIHQPEGKSPVVWKLGDDGYWSGVTKDGGTAVGDWKLEGTAVVKKTKTGEKRVDLSAWIDQSEEGIEVKGEELEVTKVPDSSTWLLSTPTGLLETPARIETGMTLIETD